MQAATKAFLGAVQLAPKSSVNVISLGFILEGKNWEWPSDAFFHFSVPPPGFQRRWQAAEHPMIASARFRINASVYFNWTVYEGTYEVEILKLMPARCHSRLYVAYHQNNHG